MAAMRNEIEETALRAKRKVEAEEDRHVQSQRELAEVRLT